MRETGARPWMTMPPQSPVVMLDAIVSSTSSTVVNVIGAAAVPTAISRAPASTNRTGGFPLPSFRIAYMVTPAAIVSQAGALTRTSQLST